MALEQRLTVKLGQRLVMTPSLQQAIKLLQMSKLELVEEVQQEMLENPVLEEQTLDGPDGPEPSSENKEERTKAESSSESSETGETPADAASEKDQPDDPFSDIDIESYFANNDEPPPLPSTREYDPELPTFEATLSETPDLTDHLTWQLDLSVSEALDKQIGRAIIGNLNDAGYLKASMEEIQAIGRFEEADVRRMIETIQGFDPIGVASADLQECLLIQLRHMDQEGTMAERLVRDHLADLEDPRRYKKLAESLDLEMEDLQAELEFLKSLDPRPGLKYNAERSTYVVPDVYVERDGDEYRILLNEDGLPKLHISPVYRRMLARGNATGEDAKEYVQKKVRAAIRLIKSLEERQRTIYKVAASIVKFQRGFLDSGIEHLRPLVLKDVAEDIGMHESTVSRVVNHKYMHTHRGLFEMRFFFHSGIASRGGKDVSSLTVKEKIKKLIKAEDPAKPLSDSAIEKLLKAEGLKIARRTVAKYREELNIPSSSNRRQVFR